MILVLKTISNIVLAIRRVKLAQIPTMNFHEASNAGLAINITCRKIQSSILCNTVHHFAKTYLSNLSLVVHLFFAKKLIRFLHPIF